MQTYIKPAVLALATMASGALAETQADPFTIDGHFGLYTGAESGTVESYFYGDGTLRTDFGSFGLELSAIGLAREGSGSTALFGGVSHTFGDGSRVVLGNPRSAFDMAPGSVLGKSIALLEASPITGAASYLTSIRLESGYAAWGLRYDSAPDQPLSYSASYHKLNDIDVSFFGAAANYDGGAYRLSAGIERIDVPGNTNVLAKLRGEYDVGQVTLGGYLSHFELNMNTFDFAEASLSYAMNDRVELGISAGHFDSDMSSGTLASAYAKYAVTDHVDARLGVFKAEGQDAEVELGLTMTF